MADAEALRPIGIHAERVANPSDFREKAFVEQWQQKEVDTLDMLLRKPCDRKDPQAVGRYLDTNSCYKRPLGPVIERDRIIVETVIQWLGSNCGMSFLHGALKSIGGEVKWPPRPGTEIPEKDCLETPAPPLAGQPPQPVAWYDLINAVLYMQNGVCPSCGYLASAPLTNPDHRSRLECDSCGFYITRSEAIAIMAETAQIRKLSVTALEKWRAARDIKPSVEHTPPRPVTDRDKVISLLMELGVAARVHSSVNGNSAIVAVTCPSRQGQPGVVFEFDRGDHSFVGMFGESA
jgi:ribosomal protein S27AE